MAVVITSSRGQIVIPREIRKKLHIVPGKKILVKAEENRAILVPLPDDPVQEFCGIRIQYSLSQNTSSNPFSLSLPSR